MTMVNLTPHTVVIRTTTDMAIPSTGVARVDSTSVGMPPVMGIPVVSSPVFGAVVGLPAPVDGTIFIVSAMVLAQCKGRTDVFAPATGPKDGAIRDDKGQIVAVTKLVAAPV